jgi:predicted metal-dependent phosphoesterase TrpH
MEIIDLHSHTTYSDGSLSPSELIERAAMAGVAALSITDHDTVAAYKDPATQAAADRAGIELVPGVELSTASDGQHMHVLGLFVNTNSTDLNKINDSQHISRQNYADSVVELFRGNGWSVDMETLMGGAVVTKAHIADIILTDRANVKQLNKIFQSVPKRGQFIETLMNEGGQYYIERENTTPDQAIKAIHAAGGIAILAHPVATLFEDGNIAAVHNRLEKYDFDGLEAFYYYFSKSDGDRRINQVGRFTRLAQEMGLAISGGSDYHGPNPSVGRHVDVGFKDEKYKPDYEMLEKLRQRRDSRYRTP